MAKKKKSNKTAKTVWKLNGWKLNGHLKAFATPVTPTVRKYKFAHKQVTTSMTNKYNLPTDNIYILNKCSLYNTINLIIPMFSWI